MEPDLGILLVTSATIGLVHTLAGPDHYVPFVVVGRARGWSLPRTLAVTFVCGVGHVLGSVLLGLVGIALGVAVHRLEMIEGVRGDIAAWLFISFGLVYTVWGLRHAWQRRPHRHEHVHRDGTRHTHSHTHVHEHSHVHERPGARELTPWILFVIFVFGPCEPLIPLLMVPAAQASAVGLGLVTAVFGLVTIGTMLVVVALAAHGVRLLTLKPVERYTHALAGTTILASGLAIRFLGW
jgi:sulfite exporter TauE/SafE